MLRMMSNSGFQVNGFSERKQAVETKHKPFENPVILRTIDASTGGIECNVPRLLPDSVFRMPADCTGRAISAFYCFEMLLNHSRTTAVGHVDTFPRLSPGIDKLAWKINIHSEIPLALALCARLWLRIYCNFPFMCRWHKLPLGHISSASFHMQAPSSFLRRQSQCN